MGECIFYEDFEFFDYGTYSSASAFTGYDGASFDFSASSQNITKFEVVNVDGNSKLAITANGQFPQIKLGPNVKNKSGFSVVIKLCAADFLISPFCLPHGLKVKHFYSII